MLDRIASGLARRLARTARRFRTRRTFLYCIGAAKTGTTSLAAMFRPHYQAEHEPETLRTTRLVIDRLEGRVPREAVATALRRRDRRLNLELESAHPLVYVSDLLVELFPEARFIITIREPLSWLRSRLNYHFKVDPPAWQPYREYFWTQRHTGYAPEERALEHYDLCSLDTYLGQYADHYRRAFSCVPPERRLIVRTSELRRAIPEIARFAGIPPESLEYAHSNREPDKICPLDEIDAGFARERIWHHCGELISEHFPETLSEYRS